MDFSYERQGAISYIVCELNESEQVDSLTLGMLTNNHINGFAPVLYTEMDGHKFLKYNISAKISLSQFFSSNMNRLRALNAFMSILNAVCIADDYMIDQNCISFNPDHIFLNVSNCESALLCIPTATNRNINDEATNTFKQILTTTNFDINEDDGYVKQMLSYVSDANSFNLYGFRDLVQNLSMQPVLPARKSQPAPNVQQNQPGYDQTISIEDVPNINVPNNNVNPAYNSGYGQNPNMPPQSVRPPIPREQPPHRNYPNPNTNNHVAPNGGIHPTPPNRFANEGVIPSNVPNIPANNNIPNGNAPQEQKKMSFFNLMMHYNKENKAIYDEQKKQKKNNKNKGGNVNAAVPPTNTPPRPGATSARTNVAIPGAVPPPRPGTTPPRPGATPPQPSHRVTPPPRPGVVPPPRPVTPPPMPVVPVRLEIQNIPNMQPVPEYNPIVQPVPVENQFNQTTVLDPIGGETTVLSTNMVPTVSIPYLIRAKTGERIDINKPVFRIGKEKSYVDYFIVDNTAISRSHCNIHTENGECYIEDTNSTNHTYVNGKLINSNVKIKLENGDKVRLANEDFTFSK